MKQFDYLWENAVLNALHNVWEEQEFDAYKDAYNIIPRDSKGDMERVRALYETYRDFTKNRFFDMGEDGNNLMDVHKVASCLTGALVKFKMLQYDVKEGLPIELMLSNYAIAFIAGINVVYLADLADTCETDNGLYEKLLGMKSFVFPSTNPGHDPYVEGRVKTLAINDLNGIDFDVLTYADMLFWIEKYNLDRLTK